MATDSSPKGASVKTELAGMPRSTTTTSTSYRLVVTTSDRESSLIGQSFALAGPKIRIGRDSGNDIVLGDSSVSSNHALLELRGEGWWCTDLASANGTFISGQRMSEPTPVRSGDLLALGPHVAMRCLTEQEAVALGRKRSPLHNALPHPLAIMVHGADAHISGLARVKALLDGMEMGMRFLAACELAQLRRGLSDNEQGRGLIALMKQATLSSRPISMGSWRMLTVKLAKLLTADVDMRAKDIEPVVRAASALVKSNGRQTTLAKRLEDMVGYRNKHVGHGTILADDAYRNDEKALQETQAAFLEGMKPLADLSLVSVADIELLDEDEGYAYQLHRHLGPAEMFPIDPVNLTARLRKPWCYLLSGERSPLCLSPLVAAAVPADHNRLEMMVAERVILGPKATVVTLRGVSSNRTSSAKLAWTSDARSLFERVV